MKLTSTNLDAQPPAPPPAEGHAEELPVWLQRVFVAVYVLFCIELGLVLIILPWMTGYWFSSGWLAQWPELRRILQSGFVRGAVSGLGLLDIWLGLMEAVRYHNRRSR